MKRLIVCMDGTWQNLAWQAVDIDPVSGLPLDRRTNVAKIAQLALQHDPADEKLQQVVYYSPGVGARTYVARSKRMNYEGATGEGAEENLIAAYMFLSFNYEPGDEIYMFGFSRGAFTVRALGGLVSRCGIIKREETAQVRNALTLYRKPTSPESLDQCKAFRKAYSVGKVANYDEGVTFDDPKAIKITYMGVFDTVVMYKTPLELAGLAKPDPTQSFHDLKIGKHVVAARHAIALDERRNALPLTPWVNLPEANQARGFDRHAPNAPFQQKWFAGAHGDVGGGESRPLSAVSRKWILRGACAAGFKVNEPLKCDGMPDNPEFLAGEIEKIKDLWYLGYKDRVVYPDPPNATEAPAGTDAQAKSRVNLDNVSLEVLDERCHPSTLMRVLHYKPAKRALFEPAAYRPRPLMRAFRRLINDKDTAFVSWLKARNGDMWT